LDLVSGREVASIAPKLVGDIALSHDGTTVAVAEGLGSMQIEVWDLAKARQSGVLRGHTATIYGLQFAPDGRLASSSWDNTIKFWDTSANPNDRQLARGGEVLAAPAVFAPGAKFLAYGQPNTTSLFTGVFRKATVID